jgi:pilus assembly protein CpaC
MKVVQHLCCAAVLAAFCWTAGRLALAQTNPPPHEIVLVEGRGRLLQFQRDISTLVVSEPKIADAVVVSPREVMVNAKGPGTTTVVVWETGSDPVQYEIRVTKDDVEWEQFTKKMQESAGDSPIGVTGTGETIVLTGMVKSAEDSKRLAGLAQTHAKNVINLLKAPPAPEPRQILLQVKFAALNRVALKQIGFNLFSTSNKLQGVSSTEQFSPPRVSALQPGTPQTVNFSDLLNLFAFRPDLGIGATIKALQEQDLLQILAEPNLLVLEGKDASFLAGGQFPFPTITTTPTGGATAPVVTVQFKPFGVKLDFTPTITSSGAIDLKVAPEVSSLDYSNAVTLQGFLIPAIAQRRVETEVVLKDGESFAIAGLIDNRVQETVDKLPGIGSIPIIGRLFSSRSTQKSDDELLIVITPHFVRPLSPEEKAKSLDMPETFLPTVIEEKSKKKGKDKTTPAPTGDKPEFVGPSGQTIPKQQQ